MTDLPSTHREKITLEEKCASQEPIKTFDQKRKAESFDTLDLAIERSRKALLSQQHKDGYWVGQLESNVSITAELIFFMRLMGIENPERQKKIANYLIKHQQEDGSVIIPNALRKWMGKQEIIKVK